MASGNVMPVLERAMVRRVIDSFANDLMPTDVEALRAHVIRRAHDAKAIVATAK